MKKLIIWVLVLILALPVLAYAGNRGKGKGNRGGFNNTGVQSYQRTAPNKMRMDNYSYPRNSNRNTGRMTPYGTSPRGIYPSNPNPYGNPSGQNPGYGW
jgi:hypothetical protein